MSDHQSTNQLSIIIEHCASRAAAVIVCVKQQLLLLLLQLLFVRWERRQHRVVQPLPVGRELVQLTATFMQYLELRVELLHRVGSLTDALRSERQTVGE